MKIKDIVPFLGILSVAAYALTGWPLVFAAVCLVAWVNFFMAIILYGLTGYVLRQPVGMTAVDSRFCRENAQKMEKMEKSLFQLALRVALLVAPGWLLAHGHWFIALLMFISYGLNEISLSRMFKIIKRAV